jgi:glutaredoxin 2
VSAMMLVVNKNEFALEDNEVFFYGLKYVLQIQDVDVLKKLDDLLETHKANPGVLFLFDIKIFPKRLINLVVFEDLNSFEVLKNDS